MMKKNLSVGKRIVWFAEATRQMLVDYAAAIHEYKALSNERRKLSKEKLYGLQAM